MKKREKEEQRTTNVFNEHWRKNNQRFARSRQDKLFKPYRSPDRSETCSAGSSDIQGMMNGRRGSTDAVKRDGQVRSSEGP